MGYNYSTLTRPIRILSDKVISQIAAGEIIERPASVLKELIENSLDADAHRIQIKSVNGGRSLIRVLDDGWGMNSEDLFLSIKRYATSKITSTEELTKISTMGFRGEALPSIAAVSQLTIRSRLRGSKIGAKIKISESSIHEFTEVGCPEGTLVEVADLFFNIPARKKFLRSQTTEAGLLAQICIRLALARPEVSLRYVSGNQTIYDFPIASNLTERTVTVFGYDLVKQMFLIEENEGLIKIIGLGGLPSLTRQNTDHIYTFVNGRFVRDRLLIYSINQAYRGLLPNNRRPVVILHIKLNPELVDINVHPTKAEIRFRHSKEIYQSLTLALRRALVRFNVPVTFRSKTITDDSINLTNLLPYKKKKYSEDTNFFTTKKYTLNYKQNSIPYELTSQNQISLVNNSDLHKQKNTESVEINFTDNLINLQILHPLFNPNQQLEIIGQLYELYILCSEINGLVIMDQHAAHERLNYEILHKQYKEATIPCQRLLTPISVKLTPQEVAWAFYQQKSWQRLGLEITPFRHYTWIITAIPTFLLTYDPTIILHDLLSEMNATGLPPDTPEFLEAGLRNLACRISLKQGQKLTFIEMKELVNKVITLLPPITCPHGRPVFLYLSRRQINRYFQRSNKNVI